jgi:hypothetical protein
MKLVKMPDGNVGLFVPLPKGPYVIDIVNSLGVFVPHDPLSNGLLNGVLKDGCNWYLLVNHWAHLRWPLKKLARIATANPDHPSLVLQPMTDDFRLSNAADPIVAIEITDIETFEECDPTGRHAMARQCTSPSDSAAPGRPNSLRSMNILNSLPSTSSARLATFPCRFRFRSSHLR